MRLGSDQREAGGWLWEYFHQVHSWIIDSKGTVSGISAPRCGLVPANGNLHRGQSHKNYVKQTTMFMAVKPVLYAKCK